MTGLKDKQIYLMCDVERQIMFALLLWFQQLD